MKKVTRRGMEVGSSRDKNENGFRMDFRRVLGEKSVNAKIF